MTLDRNFTKVAENMGGKVGENPAALRAAVFSLSSKNLRGAFKLPPPPSRARVKLESCWDMNKHFIHGSPINRYLRRKLMRLRHVTFHMTIYGISPISPI